MMIFGVCFVLYLIKLSAVFSSHSLFISGEFNALNSVFSCASLRLLKNVTITWTTVFTFRTTDPKRITCMLLISYEEN